MLALGLFCLVLISSPAWAQAAPPESAATQIELGRAALDRDPAAAIAHFEKADTPEGHAWLAVALMMESRAASDPYVERAFAEAQRSRITDAAQFHTRKQIASTLHPGDLVIVYFVGETAAYAWAFDRDAFVGYQLPPPATIVTAVDRARAYAAANDSDGVKRISDDLMPALLGPTTERLPQVQRLIVVLDGALERLPPATLSVALPRGLAMTTTSYASLMETINAPAVASPSHRNLTIWVVLIAIAAVLLAAYVSRRARRRSRARS